jgi:hypothetical protein
VAARRPDDPAREESAEDAGTAAGTRLRGADAARLHLTLAVGLAVCIGAFAFEVTRAAGGNTLSWAYVFEWPIFAVFALYMWWHLLHGQDGSRSGSSRRAGTGRWGRKDRSAGTGRPGGSSAPVGEDDADLRAWTAYLRAMEAEEARHADEPGSH